MNKLISIHDPIRSRLGVVAQGARSTVSLFAATAWLTFAATPAALADDTSGEAKDMKGVAAPVVEKQTLGSNITGLLNFDVSDKYYTPRGLESSKNGISMQPLLILFFDVYNSDKGPLTDLSFNIGVWNDVDTGTNGTPAALGGKPGNWDEIDGFAGVEAKLYKDWKLDAEETFFRSQTDSYATSTNFDFKTTYLDHWFGDSGFSINPFAEIFVETSRKATVAFDVSTDKRGFYGSFGFDPTYKFTTIPLTVELPTFANFVSEDFYQRSNGPPGGVGLAVISTEIKATTPLKFIPISYGAWSAYAGVQYYHLDNPGLEDGNQLLGNNLGDPTKRDTNLYQFHFGITCFF